MHASHLRSWPNTRAHALVLLCALLLTACGGSGGGSDDEPDVSTAPPPRPPPAPIVATGYLRSPVIEGLRYVSGAQQGVTDAQGRFTYETNTGAPVRLFVGALEVGALRSVGVMVSPFDARSDATEAANLLRLLSLLDHDADASNGVQISAAIDTMAQTWRSISFKAGEFDTAVVPYVSDVASVESGMRALPSAADSVAAMQASYNCLYAGVFTGSYFVSVDTGSFSRPDDASGRLSMVAATPDAQVFGFAYQTYPSALSTSFIGERVLASLDPRPNFTASAFRLGALMSGSFSSPDSIFGLMGTYHGWESFLRVSGSASGSRVAPVLMVYRFATSLSAAGTNYLLALDVSAELAVTGTVIMVDTSMTPVRLSGAVQANRLTAASADGRYAVEAVFDATAQELRGTLRDGTASVLPLGSDSRLVGCGV